MSNLQHRIKQLESQTQPAPARQIADDERLARMKALAVAIAQEARAQGMTMKDNPALALPLAMAGLLEVQP